MPERPRGRGELAQPVVSEAHDITIFEHGEQVSVSLHLKLPPDSSLEQAHEVPERVEDAIRAPPRVSDTLTHLEPLERPVAADPMAATMIATPLTRSR